MTNSEKGQNMTELPQNLRDWAKTCNGAPGIPVRQHLLAVLHVAEELLRRFPRFCEQCRITPQAVLFLAASHDVGKLSLDFLQLSRAWLESQGLSRRAIQEGWKMLYKRSHFLVSRDSLHKFCHEGGHCSPRSAACWAAVVGAHHGRIARRYSSAPYVPKVQERVLEQERQTCLQEMWERCGRPTLPEVDQNDPVLWSVAGLITLADWIGSDEDFFPPDTELDEPTLQQRAAEAVAAIGLGLPSVRAHLDFADIFAGRTPYPLQSMAAEVINAPGIYIIEAPMGMGKTEAALWAAYRLLANAKSDGIFFALPTQATSNRMFLRFADFVRRICPEAASTQLVHGNSWLQDDLKALARPASPGSAADPCWFSTARRALFAPFGVGTVDQALMSVLAVKHFALRRFALAGKVVVVDEVHTYDMYTGTLVRHVCRELEQLGCTVIILSATLTEEARCSLLDLPADEEDLSAPYPRISGRSAGDMLPESHPPSRPDTIVHIEHPDREAALNRALDLAGQGAHVLWICNTIARAQEDFCTLRQRAAALTSPPGTGLLHSRFPFYRREALEREWMARFGPDGERQRGAILVSTQIVEQSVDLDADALFSELAPTDMLLQRMGRLWRHQRDRRPVPHPLFCLLRETASCEEFRQMKAADVRTRLREKAHVYSPYALMRTLDIWENLEELVLPSGIRALMAATYEEKEIPPGWEDLYAERYGKNLAEKRLADMNTDIWQAALDDDAHLRTRLSGDDALFVLCTARDGTRISLLEGTEVMVPEGKISLDAAKKLHRNTVRIPVHYLGGKSADALLAPYHLDGCLLIQDKEIVSPLVREGRRFFWDEFLGVVVHKEE